MKLPVWLKLLLAIVTVIALVLFFIYLQPQKELTETQTQIIDAFGYPYQFEITYIPGGDERNPALLRKEIWYYPPNEIKITFMGGDIYNVEELPQEEVEVTQTNLRPYEFYFDQDYEDVSSILGSQNIEKLDFLPGFYREGDIETYISDKAIFIIEYGKLSFIQTLGSYESGELPEQSSRYDKDEEKFISSKTPNTNLGEERLDE